jgi:hypothetical protein
MGFVIAKRLLDQLTRTTGSARNNTQYKQRACGESSCAEYSMNQASVKFLPVIISTIAFQSAGDSVLKGHGFSRAERHRTGMEGALAQLG